METLIRKAALDLRDSHNCVSYKMETEAEGLIFSEISERINLLGGILPITIKIGGPAARGDMRTCIGLGVDGLTAPMVESEYGLKDFIRSLESVANESVFNDLLKGINIETCTAYDNLDKILASEYLNRLDAFSIGRSDLSGSLGESVDSERMFVIAADIAQRGQERGLIISVGGGITPSNVNQVIQRIRPDKVNTRNLIFAVVEGVDYTLAIQKALELEIAILEWKKKTYLDYVAMIDQRIKVITSRLEK